MALACSGSACVARRKNSFTLVGGHSDVGSPACRGPATDLHDESRVDACVEEVLCASSSEGVTSIVVSVETGLFESSAESTNNVNGLNGLTVFIAVERSIGVVTVCVGTPEDI